MTLDVDLPEGAPSPSKKMTTDDCGGTMLAAKVTEASSSKLIVLWQTAGNVTCLPWRMLGSMLRSLNRIGEGSQTQNEWDVKNALYSQKNQSCIVKKGGGIYTPNLHFKIPEIPSPARNLQNRFRPNGHFPSLECTNSSPLLGHASHVMMKVASDLWPQLHTCLHLRPALEWFLHLQRP